MEGELRALLTMTVTVHANGPATAYGEATGGMDYTLPTRVRYKRTEVATQAGEAALSDGFLWLDVDALVPSVRAKLTLPNGDLTSVLALEPVNDEMGLHHTKVYFGVPANG